jgi:hypothetical protein
MDTPGTVAMLTVRGVVAIVRGFVSGALIPVTRLLDPTYK